MKRVKLKLKKPNRLFELWLEEWMQEAAAKNSELQHHFGKALVSLRKYPLPLQSGKDCIILQNFGTKLCSMLDRKLEEHRKNAGVTSSTGEFVCTKCDYEEESVTYRRKREKQRFNPGSAEHGQQSDPAQNPGSTRSSFLTVSALGNKLLSLRYSIRSVVHICAISEKTDVSLWDLDNYVALFTLYTMTQDVDYSGHILERDVLFKMDELYCMSSKTSILNLFSDGLVSMTGSPIRYCLTDHGISTAKAILNLVSKDVSSITSIDIIKEIQTQLSLHGTKRTMLPCNTEVQNSKNKSKSPKKSTTQSLKTKPSGTAVADKEISTGEIVPLQVSKPNNTKKTSRMKQVDTNNDQEENVPADIHLEPHQFDIVLLVDTQETSGGKTKPQHDTTIVELTQLRVLFEVRRLKVGDFAWIARCRYTRKELILPYIVERKRIDDLSSSIVDGRFHEQKFRLKQSGIENIMYMIENYDKSQRLTIPYSALMQASVNSLVQDGFLLKYTRNHKDSMSYLACVTKTLITLYKGKNLVGCKKENLTHASSSLSSCMSSSSSMKLMVFDEFNKAASKQRVFKVSEMFVRQLLQLKGISVDKALAIVEKYPTPQILIEAFQKSYNNGEHMLANMQTSDKKKSISASISKAVFDLYTKKTLS